MTFQKTPLTVTQLNRQVRTWLEHEIGEVHVEGEISNLTKPASGHFYFTLKDSTSQLRCVYFRNRHTKSVNNIIKDGQQVIAHGRLSLYEPRGDYQLIVEQLEEAGEGDLYRQFELLKKKLAAEGLFDAARKKNLPSFPQNIGIITSSSGAAIRDILTTLARRYPVARIFIYPSEVQGKTASKQLINALAQAEQEQRCDVLILARGGGSIEDLWAFNDEQLARKIAACQTPIVSGVGHETDFTITDFVADVRAATPTAAAETVAPNIIELMACFQSFHTALVNAISRFINHQHLLLKHQMEKITSPGQVIMAHYQTLDYLERHLHAALKQLIIHKEHQLYVATSQLNAKNPAAVLQQASSKLQNLQNDLIQFIHAKVNLLKQQFSTQLTTLQAVSPLATLERGYAIATHQNQILFNSEALNIGDTIDVRLAKGQLGCEIISKGE